MSAKRLERSDSNRVIAGLFGGLGDYLNVDPNLLRLVGVVLLVLSPPVMVLLYTIGALLVPKAGGRSYLTPTVDMSAVGPAVVGVVLVLIGSALISPFVLSGFWYSPVVIRTTFLTVSFAAGAALFLIGAVTLLTHLRRL